MSHFLNDILPNVIMGLGCIAFIAASIGINEKLERDGHPDDYGCPW